MPFCLIIATEQPAHSLPQLARQAKYALKSLYPEHRIEHQDWGWCSILTSRQTTDARSTFVLTENGGQCLVSAGSWFYGEQLACGQEQALLGCMGEKGFAKILDEIEGVFSIAWLDKQAQRVEIAVDSAGSYHVFRVQFNDVLLISDSVLTLAALAQSPLNSEAVHQFIATGVVYGEHSIWQNLIKLTSADHLSVKAFSPAITRRTYWDFQRIQPEKYSASQAAEKIVNALTMTAKTINRHFPNALCDLTGGYDSRATITGFILANVPVSTTVSGSETSPDAQVARRIAEHFGLPHRRVERKTSFTYDDLQSALLLTDGEFDVFEYANIANTHQGHVLAGHDISINGSFGELARAYWWELLFPRIGAPIPLNTKMLAKKRFAAEYYDNSIFSASIAKIDLSDSFAQLINHQNRGLLAMPNTTQMDHAYFSMRMQRWQGRIASSTNRIWPAISPFAFRAILQPILEAKTQARLRNLLVRTMFANYLPSLGKLPLEHGYPAMPATLSNIHQFTPLVLHYGGRVFNKVTRRWQKTTLAKMLGKQHLGLEDSPLIALFEVSNLSESGIFNPERLQQFMGETGHQFHSAQWRRLITLEMTIAKVELLRGYLAGV